MFHGPSKKLCTSIAAMARRLCTEHVDPQVIQPLIACRLIPLSKNPGVRPIGVCEALRRLLGKAILRVVGPYVREVTGLTQLCAGQKSGCEIAVHALRSLFEERDSTEGILLVDASNAFNSLNRNVMLHNVQALCPAISTCVTNFYRSSAELFVGGETIFSSEGTTQGDPLSMAIYALATIPLINQAQAAAEDVTQCWFAVDAGAGGFLKDLLQWWRTLADVGQRYGYFVNPPKTWLVVKEKHYQAATSLFRSTGIQITTRGRPLLGAPLGDPDYHQEYLKSKVSSLVSQIRTLASIATTEPHAAYAAFTHGLAQKWTYLSRVTPDLSDFMQPLEKEIRTMFLATLTGRPVGDGLRDLLGLPARLGGIAVDDPSRASKGLFEQSKQVVQPAVQYVLTKASVDTSLSDVFADQADVLLDCKRSALKKVQEHADRLRQDLPPQAQLAMSLAQEQGASSWLTALPLASHGFCLSKGEFRDALCLRYGWTPDGLPSHCPDGNAFTVEHALSCPRGGYVALRHNEIRDVLAELMQETCCNVATEPELQPLSGEVFEHRTAVTADGARLDIRAGGFWATRHEVAYFDVRVFNPYAASYIQKPLRQTYRMHEQEKQRAYGERVRRIEHATLTPLVFTCTGGAGPAATQCLKRLGSQLADKHHMAYSQAMGWLRCRLSFALLRSSILCLRGARARVKQNFLLQPAVALAEGGMC